MLIFFQTTSSLLFRRVRESRFPDGSVSWAWLGAVEIPPLPLGVVVHSLASAGSCVQVTHKGPPLSSRLAPPMAQRPRRPPERIPSQSQPVARTPQPTRSLLHGPPSFAQVFKPKASRHLPPSFPHLPPLSVAKSCGFLSPQGSAAPPHLCPSTVAHSLSPQPTVSPHLAQPPGPPGPVQSTCRPELYDLCKI